MGANPGDLIGLVLREGARLVAVALALGTIAAFALSRALQGMVFQIGTTDPLTYVGMAAQVGSPRSPRAGCLHAARAGSVPSLRYVME